MSLPPPPPVSSLLLNRGPNAFILKKPVEKVEFTSVDLPHDFIGKSPTVVMRNLDLYRVYTPLDSEQTKYNLPNERMILNNRLSLMYLCGGFAGMRFSSNDMSLLSEISEKLTTNYNLVENYFQRMTGASKKIGIPPVAKPNAIEPGDVKDSTVPPEPPTDTDIARASVLEFNELVLNYLNAIKEMQIFVKEKQIEFMKNKEFEEKVVISKDPDGISSSIKPKWLVILLEKYKNSVRGGAPPVVTVGKFCRYLSILIVEHSHRMQASSGDNEWDDDTAAAIEELLQASSDNFTLFGNNSQSVSNEDETSTNASESINANNNPHPPFSQPYYARRLFNFISKLNEMKSVPKDEKSL